MQKELDWLKNWLLVKNLQFLSNQADIERVLECGDIVRLEVTDARLNPEVDSRKIRNQSKNPAGRSHSKRSFSEHLEILFYLI